jgi:hypothetical protein
MDCVFFDTSTESLNNFTKSQGLISEFKVLIERSGTLLSFSPCSTFHRSTFYTSENLTFSSTYPYQKDDRALPGDLHSHKFISVSPDNSKQCLSLLPHFLVFFLSLSLSLKFVLRLQRVKSSCLTLLPITYCTNREPHDLIHETGYNNCTSYAQVRLVICSESRHGPRDGRHGDATRMDKANIST